MGIIKVIKINSRVKVEGYSEIGTVVDSFCPYGSAQYRVSFISTKKLDWFKGSELTLVKEKDNTRQRKNPIFNGEFKSPDYPKYDDAAAFYPKLNIDKKMIDAWSKLINKQGGKILMTSSPMGSSWFYEKYKHSNPNKEKQMNKTIAELFKDSKGSDMMLVNMWFPMIGETRADVILWEGKQGELLAKANELEAESKK